MKNANPRNHPIDCLSPFAQTAYTSQFIIHHSSFIIPIFPALGPNKGI
jgi:hypothetical protein